MLSVPEWVRDYVQEWRDVLLLHEWRIHIALALCVYHDPDCRGLTETCPDVNEATITFRADIEETDDWKRTIIHELLHVRHARIDHYIQSALLPGLPDGRLAMVVYHQYNESFIAGMANSLYTASTKQ